MIVNVLNDEELPTIVFAREHSLVHKTGEANAIILMLVAAKQLAAKREQKRMFSHANYSFSQANHISLQKIQVLS